MGNWIPYARQSINQADIDAVAKALQSDFLTTGPLVEKFEAKFAETVGAASAVAVSSGTAALHAAMFAIDLQPGDEVIVPAITFMATANAVAYLGGVPVFADVNADTLLVDVEDVESKITGKTKAIISMDYAGQPCDYDSLLALADQYRLWYISDSCHSLGSSFKKRYDFRYASPHISCYSFHPTKAITTGEGGMVATSVMNPEVVPRLKQFRNHGRTIDGMMDLGFNYRLSDVACALGISQLNRLEEFIVRRRAIATKYAEAFADLPGIQPLAVLTDRQHAYHLYVVRVDNRDFFREFLLGRGIETQVHYRPVNLEPFYNQPGACPVAEREWEKIVSLPIHPSLRDEDVDRIIDVTKEFAK